MGILVWFAALGRRQSVLRPAAIYLPLGVYVLASVVSALLSAEPRYSLGELFDLLTLLLVPMSVSLLTVDRWRRLVLMLAAVAAASAAVALWQYGHGASTLANRLHGFADHYMTFAGWMLLVVLLLVCDALFEVPSRRLAWTVPTAVIGAVSIVLSFTRGAWIGLAVGLVLAGALWRPKVLLLSPLLVAVVALVVPRSIVDRAVSIVDLHDPSNYDRVCMATAGLGMVRDHPLLGVGPGMVEPIYSRYRVEDAPQQRVPHLHNNLVQIAAERGLLALGGYLGALAAFVVVSWRALRREGHPSRPAVVGCLVAIIGLSVAGFFEYNWGDAEIWIPTLACLALPFALADREQAMHE